MIVKEVNYRDAPSVQVEAMTAPDHSQLSEMLAPMVDAADWRLPSAFLRRVEHLPLLSLNQVSVCSPRQQRRRSLCHDFFKRS